VKYQVTVAGRTFDIEVLHSRLVRVNGRSLYVDLDQVGGLPIYSLTLDDAEYVVFVDEGQQDYQVEVGGRVYDVGVESQFPRLEPRRSASPGDSGTCLTVSAPLAGCVISVPVRAGEWVEAGQLVAVVESMKMQMKVTSPQPGVVEMVHGLPGQDVAQGDKLVTLRTG
jgi:biotin carboxyl carrier protein